MNLVDREILNPSVHCFARCHWCKRLIRITRESDGLNLTERECPHCGAALSARQIKGSFAVNLIHTQAITSANKLIALDLAVIPFVACTVLIALMDFPLWVRIPYLLFYHAWPLLGLKWFRVYWYRIRFTDDEYLEAVSGMKRFLLIWIVANLINWIAVIAQVTYFP